MKELKEIQRASQQQKNSFTVCKFDFRNRLRPNARNENLNMFYRFFPGGVGK